MAWQRCFQNDSAVGHSKSTSFVTILSSHKYNIAIAFEPNSRKCSTIKRCAQFDGNSHTLSEQTWWSQFLLTPHNCCDWLVLWNKTITGTIWRWTPQFKFDTIIFAPRCDNLRPWNLFAMRSPERVKNGSRILVHLQTIYVNYTGTEPKCSLSQTSTHKLVFKLKNRWKNR